MQQRPPPVFGAPPSPPQIAQRQAAPQMYQVNPTTQPNTPFFRQSLASFSVGAATGMALLTLCIIGVVLNSSGVSYFSANEGTAENEDWVEYDYDDVKSDMSGGDSGVDTYDILYKTPATLFIIGIIFGAILIFVDMTPSTHGVKSIVSSILFASTSLIGFFLLLSGGNWLGMYISQIMSSEDELSFHLAAVPYYFILSGIILILLPMQHLMAELSFLTGQAIQDKRTLCFGLFSLAKRTLFASAICLSLLPLAPVFFTEQEYTPSDGESEKDRKFFTPLEMEFSYDYAESNSAFDSYWGDSDEGEATERVYSGLHHSTSALWWIFWASICFLVISLFTVNSGQSGRLSENLFHLHGLLIIPVIIGLVYSIIMYANVTDMTSDSGSSSYSSETKVALNWFMPITFTFLLVVWFSEQLPKTLIPWAKKVQANRQASIMAMQNIAYGQMQMSAINQPQIQQPTSPQYQQVPPLSPQVPVGQKQGFPPYDPTRKY